MSTSARVVIHLLTLECGSPLDAPPSREEKKLADRIARILRMFEDKQLEEIHDEENLEIEEDELDGEWNIIDEEEDLNLEQPAGSKTITFSGGQEVPEDRVWVAAEYHWSTSRKSSRSRKSTQHRFAFLRNERDWPSEDTGLWRVLRHQRRGQIAADERGKAVIAMEGTA